MSRKEAIKILEYNLENSDDSIFDDVPEAIKTQYLALQLTIAQALKLLESEPKPGEFMKECRAYAFFDAEHPASHKIVGMINRLREACDRLGRLQANLTFTEQELGAANAELKDLKEMKLWKPENLQSKSNYQPEPEFVDLEIIRSGSWLGCVCTKPEGFYELGRLPGLPNFEGFKLIHNGGEQSILLEHVANNLNQKNKVIARFRK